MFIREAFKSHRKWNRMQAHQLPLHYQPNGVTTMAWTASPQPQIDYRYSTTSSVSVGPRDNLLVVLRDKHKSPSVGLLDTKVYLLLNLHSSRRKETNRAGNESPDLDWENHSRAKGTARDFVISFSLTRPPLPSGWRLSSVASLLLLLFLWLPWVSSGLFILLTLSPTALYPILFIWSPNNSLPNAFITRNP